MILVIISWIMLFAILLVFGDMAISIWNIITKRNDSYPITHKFWIGISFIGTLLLYISIFAPLNIWVFSALIGAAFLYGICKRVRCKGCISRWKKTISQTSVLERIALVLIFIIVLIYSLSTPLIYDEGLYHLQTMQWTEQYSTVIGLGNLHGRLGFNSSALLLSTVFNHILPKQILFFSINSFCLLVFAIWLARLIYETKNSVKSVAAIVFVLLASLFSLGPNISSTSTDIIPNILVIYLLISLSKKSDSAKNYPLLFVLASAFCITLKLSSVSIVLLALATLFFLFRQGDRKAMGVGLALCIAIALPWITRFVILTGYLVYPFPSIDIFDVDWKIPIEMVTYEKDIAYAWARIPNMEPEKVLAMSITEWIPLWISQLSNYNLLIYILAFISPIFVLVWRAKRILPWAIAYLGICFGLFTAPDFRFGFGFLIAAIVIPFLLESRQQKRPNLYPVIKGGLIVPLIGLIYIAYAQVSHYQTWTDKSPWSLILKPQEVDLLQKKSNIQFKEYDLNTTTLFVPQGTDRCIDQGLPCSPYYNSNLELRGNKLQDGFRIKNN